MVRKRIAVPRGKGCFGAAALAAACLGGAPAGVSARVGETEQELERRLVNSTGIQYRDEAIVERRRRGMPYASVMDYLPADAKVEVYFKSADGSDPGARKVRQKRMPPGWNLHVLYVGGVSKLEVYERSKGMTQHEFNALLSLLRGGSHWKKRDGGDGAFRSVFGADMVRADGKLRAKRLGGNALLVVDSELDATLAERREAERAEKAPESVSGF